MRRTYGYADLGAIYQWGAGFARDDVMLADIYVAPDLLLPAPIIQDRVNKAQVADEVVSEVERERRRHAGQLDADKERRSSAANIAADADRLLIVGAPGQGKSTLPRHLLLDATERWLVDPLNAPFPCLVRLSRWSDAGGPPEGRLSRYLSEHLPGFAEISKDAAAAWYAGKMLWLLDGIDEIRGGAARERFQEELVRLAAPGTRHRFVVSTRPAGEPRGGLGTEWLRTELPALAEPQVLIALRNWSRVLREKDDLYLDAVDFAAKLATNPGLRQVRGNALLLTMAVLFFKQRKRLPNDRWEFYNGAEQSLRDSWARHRLNDRDAASLPGDYAANVLETLALDGMLKGRVLFTHEQVATAVRNVLIQRKYTGGEQDAEIPRFADAARDAIGVFVEQAPERFGFVHLTFQEFLAARALVRRGDDAPSIIEQFWDHPDWHETWLLYALGCQSLQGRFSTLFQIVLQPRLRNPLDQVLRRQERFILRLAGVGTESLPAPAEFGLSWARKSIATASVNHLAMTLQILAAWERALPQDIQDLLVQRMRLSDFIDRESAIQVLAAQCLSGDSTSHLNRLPVWA